MVNYADFGARVRSARRARGLTQENLAEQIGISTSFMGHIERGTRIASLDTLVALCNALEISPHELLQASLQDEIDRMIPSELTGTARTQLNALLRMANGFLTGERPEDE